MVISTEPAWGQAADHFVPHHESAVVYADMDGDSVLHDGERRLLANGWVELPTGRLLSPGAIHHIDT